MGGWSCGWSACVLKGRTHTRTHTHISEGRYEGVGTLNHSQTRRQTTLEGYGEGADVGTHTFSHTETQTALDAREGPTGDKNTTFMCCTKQSLWDKRYLQQSDTEQKHIKSTSIFGILSAYRQDVRTIKQFLYITLVNQEVVLWLESKAEQNQNKKKSKFSIVQLVAAGNSPPD